jgi:hypothetical protein
MQFSNFRVRSSFSTMDASDFEDMLFGIADTQDLPDNILLEDSDEDILFPDIEDEPILWDLPNDQLLTPSTSSPGPGEVDIVDSTKHHHMQIQQQPTNHIRKPVRDRYCCYLCMQAHCR